MLQRAIKSAFFGQVDAPDALAPSGCASFFAMLAGSGAQSVAVWPAGQPSQMTPQRWQSVEGIGSWQEEAARHGATVLEMYCRGESKDGVWLGKLCTGYGYRR